MLFYPEIQVDFSETCRAVLLMLLSISRYDNRGKILLLFNISNTELGS